MMKFTYASLVKQDLPNYSALNFVTIIFRES